MPDAREVIEQLGLAPHPEGGWYVETWRAGAPPGERAAASAILFLLAAGESSHWHRVDAAELWLHHAGDQIELAIASSDEGPVSRHRVGGNVLAGEEPQVVVPAGAWQSARSLGGWSLVSCVVAPAFGFDGFQLAPPGWSPDAGGQGEP